MNRLSLRFMTVDERLVKNGVKAIKVSITKPLRIYPDKVSVDESKLKQLVLEVQDCALNTEIVIILMTLCEGWVDKGWNSEEMTKTKMEIFAKL